MNELKTSSSEATLPYKGWEGIDGGLGNKKGYAVQDNVQVYSNSCHAIISQFFLS